jgi:hypothetical protein
VEGLSHTEQNHVTPHRDMRFSRDDYEAKCLIGCDAVYHGRNLEGGGYRVLQNVSELLQEYTM